jgi:hypothetical protein
MLNLMAALTFGRHGRNKGTARDRASEQAASGARARTAGTRETSEPRLASVPVPVGRTDDLLRQCKAQSAKGTSFDAIYDDLLRPNALIGNGVATLAAEQGVLRKVPLRNGGAVVFNESTKRWNIERHWSLRC